MQRLVVLALSVVVFVTLLGAGPAGAAKPDRYRSQIFNAYWNSRHKISHHTYHKTQWYTGVYSSGDEFFSDLYKNVQRCTRHAGHTRCKEITNWYGSIRDLGTGSFAIDRKLDTGTLTATYRLDDAQTGKLVGVTAVTVNLIGVGDVATERSRETYTEGCRTFRYSSKSSERAAYATGTFQIGTQAAEKFGFTADAFMSRGSQLEFSKTC
jgi:hypothetical protein